MGPQIQLAGYVSCINLRARCVTVLVRGLRTVCREYAVPLIVVITGACGTSHRGLQSLWSRARDALEAQRTALPHAQIRFHLVALHRHHRQVANVVHHVLETTDQVEFGRIL